MTQWFWTPHVQPLCGCRSAEAVVGGRWQVAYRELGLLPKR